MNKSDIKAKWGQYTDTDKLVDDMMSLLTKYNHRNTEHGVCCILDEFFKNKEPLIKLLQKSEHYVGNLRIVLDEQIERRSSVDDVNRWITHFPSKIGAKVCIMKTTDSNGKTIGDYLKIGKEKVSIDDFENEDFVSSLSQRNDAINGFNSDGFTVESVQAYDKFIRVINCFQGVTSGVVPERIVESLSAYKINEGTKTSRAFNKICAYFGADKSQTTIINSHGQKQRAYDVEFAKYADMVNGLKRQIKFFISVNPLDYLTMSFGVNWASCHTIDKENVRRLDNNYSGMYCGGTISYMLDTTSIITYVHDTMPEDHETGKVYRNMFHFGGDGVLLQGRIYPQGNDGCTDLYQEFRYIVQAELAKILELDNNKWIKRSAVINVTSRGCHYKDYQNFSSCNISYPAERSQCQHQIIIVGHIGICPYCGESTEGLNSSSLTHSGCCNSNVFEF